jgi:hypothetical protein
MGGMVLKKGKISAYVPKRIAGGEISSVERPS